MKKAFRLFLTTIAIAILLSTGMAQTHARRLEIGIDISAMRHISLPDSIDPETHTDFERQWKYLLMKRKLNPTDSTVIWPRFVRFCINTFNWIDRTFNSYDTLYVKPHHLKGKAMLVCDNWTDYYDFHPRDVIPVVMSSKYHPSIGLYAQYSILSVGYSIDVNTLFKNEKSNTTRFDFAFSCAKFNFEAHYWYNSGGIYIRDFGDFRKDTGKKGLLDIKFDGMTFRGLNVTAYHFSTAGNIHREQPTTLPTSSFAVQAHGWPVSKVPSIKPTSTSTSCRKSCGITTTIPSTPTNSTTTRSTPSADMPTTGSATSISSQTSRHFPNSEPASPTPTRHLGKDALVYRH